MNDYTGDKFSRLTYQLEFQIKSRVAKIAFWQLQKNLNFDSVFIFKYQKSKHTGYSANSPNETLKPVELQK